MLEFDGHQWTLRSLRQRVELVPSPFPPLLSTTIAASSSGTVDMRPGHACGIEFLQCLAPSYPSNPARMADVSMIAWKSPLVTQQLTLFYG